MKDNIILMFANNYMKFKFKTQRYIACQSILTRNVCALTSASSLESCDNAG